MPVGKKQLYLEESGREGGWVGALGPRGVEGLDVACGKPGALVRRVPGGPGRGLSRAPALPRRPFRGAVLLPTGILRR